jgi:hypothetical protein
VPDHDALTELIDLERRGWAALGAGGEQAAAFYDDVLADDVLFLLPGGLAIDDRQAVVESMSGPPWDSYELRDERVVALGSAAAVVAYRATATRGDTTYDALFASTYVQRGGRWRLVAHQQTPA